jgi:hypothetical protein
MTAAKWAYGSAAIAANGSGRKRQEHQYIQQVLDAAFRSALERVSRPENHLCSNS